MVVYLNSRLLNYAVRMRNYLLQNRSSSESHPNNFALWFRIFIFFSDLSSNSLRNTAEAWKEEDFFAHNKALIILDIIIIIINVI